MATNPPSLVHLLQQRPMRQGQRGVALVMTLFVLAMLLAITLPFVLQSGHHEASAIAYRRRVQARMGAMSAIDHAISQMRQTNRLKQQERRIDVERSEQEFEFSPFYDERYDPPSEFTIDLASEFPRDFGSFDSFAAFDPNGNLRSFHLASDRNQIWSAQVIDEQGRINLNTATPALIGNILGSTVVREVEGNLPTLILECDADAHAFPEGPSYFVANGMLCKYRKRRDNRFEGVNISVPYNNDFLELSAKDRATSNTRHLPVFRELATPQASAIGRGTLIIPLVAHLVAYNRLMRASGRQPGVYDNVDQMREVAELGILDDATHADAFTGARWMAARDFFTVSSTGPCDNGFFYPQIATSVFRASSELPHRAISLSRADVANPEWLEPSDPRRGSRGIAYGSTVRLSYEEGRPIQALFYGQLLTPELVPEAYAEGGSQRFAAMVETQERTPININTAPWEVLVANLKGLRSGSDVIGRAEAEAVVRGIVRVRSREALAKRDGYEALDRKVNRSPLQQEPNALVQGGIRNDAQLDEILDLLVEGKVIEGWVRRAIMAHQRSPNDNRQTALAPFCYKSYGAIRIDGVATTFAPSGLDTARSHIREFVRVGSDEPATYSWRPLDVMRENAELPLGNIITLRRSSPVQEGRFLSVVAELPWLLDQRAISPTAGRQVWRLGEMSTLRPPIFKPGSEHRTNMRDGGPGETIAMDLDGGMIEFWYQVPQGPLDNTVIFDSGFSETESRITLLWWQPPRTGRLQSTLPGLALRLTDRAIENAYTVAYMKPGSNMFEAGQWYHIRCSWKGLELSDLSLTVDSLANMGDPPAQPLRVDHVSDNGAGVYSVRSSTLRSDIDPLLGNSSVDEIIIERGDAFGFAPRGVIQVGDEAIEYRRLTATGFQGLTRGARGTTQTTRTIPAGSRVGQFGYTVPVVSHNQAPYAIAGGAQLASTLDQITDFSVERNAGGRADGDLYLPEDLNNESGIPRGASIISMTPYNAVPNLGLAYVRGPAWKTYSYNSVVKKLVPDPTNDGSSPCVVDATGTVILPPVQEAWLLFQKDGRKVRILEHYGVGSNGQLVVQDFDNQWHFLGATSSGLISANGYEERGTTVILSSIHLSAEGSYFDPTLLPNVDSLRVQIDQEWITYTNIVEYGTRLMAYVNPGSLRSLEAAVRAYHNSTGTTMPLHPMRSPGTDPLTGFNLSSAQTQVLGQDVVPLIALGLEQSRRAGAHRTGAEDLITIGKELGGLPNVAKQQRKVVRVENLFRIVNGRSERHYQLVGLDASLRQDYEANTSYCIKFPSMELPRGMPAQLRFGGSFVRGIASKESSPALVDELVAQSFNVADFRLMNSCSAAQTYLIVNTHGSSLPLGTGMIKIDDEYIVYNGRVGASGGFRLNNCVRGVLGTMPSAHAGGASVFNQAGVPVFTLTNPTQANDSLVTMTGGNAPLSPFGFIRLERGNTAQRSEMEIIGYNEARGGIGGTTAVAGFVHPTSVFDLPLFRGAYGTRPRQWPENTVAVAFPVREPDYTPRWLLDENAITNGAIFSPEIAHLRGTESFAPAKVRSLRWSLDDFGNPRARDNMIARIFVRFNDDGPWLDGGDQVLSSLFDFGKAKLQSDAAIGRNEMSVDLRELAAGRLISRVEWIVVMGFRDGAWVRDGWKQTLRFRGVEVDLESETRVIRHEEIDG